MPIRFTISETPRLCYAVYMGTVTLQELVENYGQYVAHKFYLPGMAELIDLTTCDFSQVSVEMLTPVAKAANSMNLAKGVVTPTCIYAPNERAVAAATLYKTVNDGFEGVDIAVCKTGEECLRFLGLDNDFENLKALKEHINP